MGNPTQRQEISVNVLNSTNGIDCSKDIPLLFGDQIEIPEREHTLSEPMAGLTQDQWSDLTACLKRKVTFVVKGQTKEITTGPTWLSAAVGFPSVQNVLRSSSDLSHIHIRRTDPVAGEVKELVLNEGNSTSPGANGAFSPPFPGQRFPGQNAAAPDDLWLRDGDVIEVPDKP